MNTKKHVYTRRIKTGLFAGISVGLLSVVDISCYPESHWRLQVWQPEEILTTSGTILDIAPKELITKSEKISAEIEIDAQKNTFVLNPAQGLVLPALLIPPTGAVGSMVLTSQNTEQEKIPDAIARTGKIDLLRSENEFDVTTSAIFAPPSILHTLVVDFPDARQQFSVCTSKDDDVMMLGGKIGERFAVGNFWLDPRSRSVRTGPTMPQDAQQEMRGAGCSVDLKERLWLFGGCALNGNPSEKLWMLDTQANDFDGELQELPIIFEGAGCGTDVEVFLSAEGETLWLFYGTKLEIRKISGELIDTLVFEEPRFFADIAVITQNPPTVIVAGGYASLEEQERQSAPISGAVVISRVGQRLTTRDLSGVDPQNNAAEDEELVLLYSNRFQNVVQVFDQTGISQINSDVSSTKLIDRNALALPTDFVPKSFAQLLDGTWVFLREDGAALWLTSAKNTTTERVGVLIPINPARPDTTLLPDHGGALRMWGGGRGVLTLVPQ